MSLLTDITNSWIYKYKDILLILGVGVLVYFLVQKPKGITTQVTNPLQLKQVDSMRDINGKLYAQIAQQVYQLSQIKTYSDSLAKALKLKPKYIQGVDQIAEHDSIIYKEEPIVKDTTSEGGEVYTIEDHDAWSDVVATINARQDSASIKYSSRDTLTRVQVVNTHTLLGLEYAPTTYSILIHNANPHNIIQEGASFQVAEKRTFLTIGPDLQYNPFTNKLNLGISVQYPILQFKK